MKRFWPMDFHQRQRSAAVGASRTNQAFNIRGNDLLTCRYPGGRFMLTFS